jgi:DNA-directed RNA polymerase specialized sigma24 family protein
MKSLTTEDRADLVSKLVMRCVQDNFRILRTYEDRGKPFANWLLVVAQRMAVREARRVRAHVPIVLDHQDHSRLHEESLCDSGPSQGANLELKETATTIMECLREMNPKHRTLLIGAANGMTGRELAVLLHGALTGDDALDAQLAKNALDSLRYARRLLRRRLRDHGIDVLRVA